MQVLICCVFSICLALSGPQAMAQDQNGAFSIVICTDGGTQTITLVPDGQPAEKQTVAHCPKCIAAAKLTLGLADASFMQLQLLSYVQMKRDVQTVQQVHVTHRNMRPIPRGPPRDPSSKNRLPHLIASARVIVSFEHVGDLCPIPKDALA